MQSLRELCSSLIPLSSSQSRVIEIRGRILREERKISEGGYAYVSAARDVNTAEVFALKKTICQDKERLRMAKAEVVLLESLPPHPNVVRFYGASIIPAGRFREVCLLLEFCEGGHLVPFLESQPDPNDGLEEILVMHILRDVNRGLAHLHQQVPSIVHCDVKVENILCVPHARRRGGRSTFSIHSTQSNASGTSKHTSLRWYLDASYKLCDFGSVRIGCADTSTGQRDEILKLEEEISGRTTPMYRPPEMVDLYLGYEVGPQVDMWMLGCVLFVLCFNRHPFQSDSTLAIANASYDIPSSHKYSEGLMKLLRNLLSRRPADRPKSSDLLTALESKDSLAAFLNAAQRQVDEERVGECKRIRTTNRNRMHISEPGQASAIVGAADSHQDFDPCASSTQSPSGFDPFSASSHDRPETRREACESPNPWNSQTTNTRLNRGTSSNISCKNTWAAEVAEMEGWDDESIGNNAWNQVNCGGTRSDAEHRDHTLGIMDASLDCGRSSSSNEVTGLFNPPLSSCVPDTYNALTSPFSAPSQQQKSKFVQPHQNSWNSRYCSRPQPTGSAVNWRSVQDPLCLSQQPSATALTAGMVSTERAAVTSSTVVPSSAAARVEPNFPAAPLLSPLNLVDVKPQMQICNPYDQYGSALAYRSAAHFEPGTSMRVHGSRSSRVREPIPCEHGGLQYNGDVVSDSTRDIPVVPDASVDSVRDFK